MRLVVFVKLFYDRQDNVTVLSQWYMPGGHFHIGLHGMFLFSGQHFSVKIPDSVHVKKSRRFYEKTSWTRVFCNFFSVKLNYSCQTTETTECISEMLFLR